LVLGGCGCALFFFLFFLLLFSLLWFMPPVTFLPARACYMANDVGFIPPRPRQLFENINQRCSLSGTSHHERSVFTSFQSRLVRGSPFSRPFEELISLIDFPLSPQSLFPSSPPRLSDPLLRTLTLTKDPPPPGPLLFRRQTPTVFLPFFDP